MKYMQMKYMWLALAAPLFLTACTEEGDHASVPEYTKFDYPEWAATARPEIALPPHRLDSGLWRRSGNARLATYTGRTDGCTQMEEPRHARLPCQHDGHYPNIGLHPSRHHGR